VAKIKGWVEAGKKFKVSYGGSFDQLPAHFDVKVRMHIIVTAGV